MTYQNKYQANAQAILLNKIAIAKQAKMQNYILISFAFAIIIAVIAIGDTYFKVIGY